MKLERGARDTAPEDVRAADADFGLNIHHRAHRAPAPDDEGDDAPAPAPLAGAAAAAAGDGSASGGGFAGGAWGGWGRSVRKAW